jgi:hypothetical protein
MTGQDMRPIKTCRKGSSSVKAAVKKFRSSDLKRNLWAPKKLTAGLKIEARTF